MAVITIKRLSHCSFAEATAIWNNGFAGYFVDAAMSEERFVARLGLEGIYPSLSLVAYVDEEPAGMVLSGIRMIQGKKVAWNGGTCVATAFRGQGVAKALMEAAMQVYQEEGVEVATLEAFRQNERAISLYERMGYQVRDHLLFLTRTEDFASTDPFFQMNAPYVGIKGVPADVQLLPFYQAMAPWQTQWSGIHDGESVVVTDSRGEVVGYALYKRIFDEAGGVAAITLFQCAAAPEREDAEEIIRYTLTRVFAPESKVGRRGTFNFPASQELVVHILEEAGFVPSIEQVYMVKML